jgi:hypothetical protein
MGGGGIFIPHKVASLSLHCLHPSTAKLQQWRCHFGGYIPDLLFHTPILIERHTLDLFLGEQRSIIEEINLDLDHSGF